MGEPGDKRGGDRTPVGLLVRLSYGSVDEFVDRFATNLSRGGVFIRTRSPKPPGTQVAFELKRYEQAQEDLARELEFVRRNFYGQKARQAKSHEKRAARIADGFIRVSAGIENADDLLEDLERGFAAARGA